MQIASVLSLLFVVAVMYLFMAGTVESVTSLDAEVTALDAEMHH